MPLYNLLVREFKRPNHKYYADGETDIHREGEGEGEGERADLHFISLQPLTRSTE